MSSNRIWFAGTRVQSFLTTSADFRLSKPGLYGFSSSIEDQNSLESHQARELHPRRLTCYKIKAMISEDMDSATARFSQSPDRSVERLIA